ncbi:hypothetical protein AHAS_Ahas04G0116200 [Arachis hypogaea]
MLHQAAPLSLAPPSHRTSIVLNLCRIEAPSHPFPDLLPLLLASFLSNPNLQSANLAKVWRLDFQFHAINSSFTNRSSPSRALCSFSSSAAAFTAIVQSFATTSHHNNTTRTTSFWIPIPSSEAGSLRRTRRRLR